MRSREDIVYESAAVSENENIDDDKTLGEARKKTIDEEASIRQ